jgi:SpoVK/Ycf46/Vps4 family AAA+-type ATPase
MGKEQDLLLLIKSGAPLVVIETDEELRAIDMFQRLLVDALRPLFKWSIASGLDRIDVALSDFGIKNDQPEMVLDHIARNIDPSIYLLLDFHPFLEDPINVRRLREIALRHNVAEHTVVLISPELQLPEELKGQAATVGLSLPDDKTLDRMVREEAFAWSRKNDGRRVTISRESLAMLIRNLRGLTFNDARHVARNAIYNDGAISNMDLPRVMEEKFKLLNRDGVLSFEYENINFDDIAGLRKLKQWIIDRKPIFESDEENPYGLEAPKGVLLLGVQGCGKSLAAKAVAAGFGVPLMRLDFGSIYNKYHGETEKNLRESLSSAEVMAPCVMWIDEIEKGISVGDSDGGTSKRVLGTLLTWMAERKSKVFLIATANDIESLPPELIRKGRFDEIFFVDLPKHPVRAKIFEIHINKRKQDAAQFDLEALATASDGFSGAEIEQAVVSGLYASMAAEKPLSVDQILSAIQSTRPLSVVMAERIDYLRSWASERTVNAD